MAAPEPDEVMALLRGVIDPELGSDIVELGMAKGVDGRAPTAGWWSPSP